MHSLLGTTEYGATTGDSRSKGAKKLKAGAVLTARVTSADEYDLWAEPV